MQNIEVITEIELREKCSCIFNVQLIRYCIYYIEFY